MKYNSLGMIETNGLVSALAAINKILEVGKIEFVKKEVISNGQVTIIFKGDSSEIENLVEAGVIAANKVGAVVASLAINEFKEELEKIIIGTQNRGRVKKNKKERIEEDVPTLFDSGEDDINSNAPRNIKKAIEKIVDKKDSKKELDDTLEIHTSIKNDDNKRMEIQFEPKEEVFEKEKIDSNKELISNIDKQDEDTQNNNMIESDIEEKKNSVSLNIAEEVAVSEIDENEVNTQEMSHIERLRAEAKSEIVNKVDVQESEAKSNSVSEDISKMNVHELRKLARSMENFPIKGREISKANRKVLLSYFEQL